MSDVELTVEFINEALEKLKDYKPPQYYVIDRKAYDQLQAQGWDMTYFLFYDYCDTD